MRLWCFMIGVVLTCIMGCASIESAFEEEKEIPLSQVPIEAVEAAQDAVEGITLTEAEVEEEDGCTVYELEGTANGTVYEIEVTTDGKILEVVHEDEDDDELQASRGFVNIFRLKQDLFSESYIGMIMTDKETGDSWGSISKNFNCAPGMRCWCFFLASETQYGERSTPIPSIPYCSASRMMNSPLPVAISRTRAPDFNRRRVMSSSNFPVLIGLQIMCSRCVMS